MSAGVSARKINQSSTWFSTSHSCFHLTKDTILLRDNKLVNWFTVLSGCITAQPHCYHDENTEEYDCNKLNRKKKLMTNKHSQLQMMMTEMRWIARSWACCACLAQIESKDAQGLWSCLWGVPDVPVQGNVKAGLFAEVMPSHYIYNSSIKQKRERLRNSFFLCTTEQLRFVSKGSLDRP